MTLLDKIKLIDFYLHGVDRGVKIHYSLDFNEKGEQDSWYTDSKFNDLKYHTSLDALRPVIVKLNDDLIKIDRVHEIESVMVTIRAHFIKKLPFEIVFDSVVECIKYLNDKEK